MNVRLKHEHRPKWRYWQFRSTTGSSVSRLPPRVLIAHAVAGEKTKLEQNDCPTEEL